MRLLRGLAGALLWVVSLVLLLVAVILCVTVILLPLGIPLLGYARRLFTTSLKLMLPHAVSHPVKTADKAIGTHGRRARKQAKKDGAAAKRDVQRMRKKGTRVRKKVSISA
jgi:hypothetical protein